MFRGFSAPRAQSSSSEGVNNAGEASGLFVRWTPACSVRPSLSGVFQPPLFKSCLGNGFTIWFFIVVYKTYPC